MNTKNIVKVLETNKTILKTDRSHLKAEKNRIYSVPINDINYTLATRYVDEALNDVRHLKVVKNLRLLLYNNNPMKNEALTLNKYHIYSKKHLIKILNKDAQNKQLTFHSIANSLHSFKYPSNKSDTISALVSNQLNGIKHLKYRYYLCDALDNADQRISVSYTIYVLTDLIDETSREIHLARTNVGKALITALSIKKAVDCNHSLKYNHNVMRNLLTLPNQNPLKQSVKLVFKDWNIASIPVTMDGLLYLYRNSHQADSDVWRDISDLKKLAKQGHMYTMHNLKYAKFVAFNIDKFLKRVINHLDELLGTV